MNPWDVVVDSVIAAITLRLLDALDVLWSLLSATAFRTPDVTLLPQVEVAADTSLNVVNICYVLAILLTAATIMGRGSVRSEHGLNELIPRLLLGLIGANFSMPLCSTLIELANAVTLALTADPIGGPKAMLQLYTLMESSLEDAEGAVGGLLIVVVALLITVAAGLLMVQSIVRVGLLILLVGIAPIALAMHGTPQTEPVAKLWWRALIGALGVVVIQAFGLHLALQVLLTSEANLAVAGLPDNPSPTLNLLIVLCMLVGVLKIPALMRRYVTQSRPRFGGQIVRYLLMHQLTRGLSTLFLSRRGSMLRRAQPKIAHRAFAAARMSRPSRGRAPVRRRPAPIAARPARRRAPQPADHRRLPPPRGSGPGQVGIAYPTGRVVRPYTPEELRAGVDLYTRARKAKATPPSTGGRKP